MSDLLGLQQRPRLVFYENDEIGIKECKLLSPLKPLTPDQFTFPNPELHPCTRAPSPTDDFVPVSEHFKRKNAICLRPELEIRQLKRSIEMLTEEIKYQRELLSRILYNQTHRN